MTFRVFNYHVNVLSNRKLQRLTFSMDVALQRKRQDKEVKQEPGHQLGHGQIKIRIHREVEMKTNRKTNKAFQVLHVIQQCGCGVKQALRPMVTVVQVRAERSCNGRSAFAVFGKLTVRAADQRECPLFSDVGRVVWGIRIINKTSFF